MLCHICNNENPDEFVFCIECGARVVSGAPPAWPAQPDGGPRRDGPPPPIAMPDNQRGGFRAHEEPLPRARPHLVVTDAQGRQADVDLRPDVTTIGRSSSNDVVIEDHKVSRQHARIVGRGSAYLVEDLNSRNGTRVDDHTITEPVSLREGAVIKIGDSRLQVAGVGAGHAAPGLARPEPRPHGAEVPVVFAVSWSPLQCPRCQGMSSLRPILYGPAARSAAAQEAAARGEAFLGGPGVGPDGPNAQCTVCDGQVRIIPASPS